MKNEIDKNQNCPVCSSFSTTHFLSRRQVPVHQNLVVKEQSLALNVTRGDLDLLVCESCGFIFNQAFDLDRLSYNDEYDNTQSCSPLFERYLDDLVRYLVLERDVQKCQVVEVGCGKGLFLQKIVEFEESENVGWGFDPSYIGPENLCDGRLKFVKRYYDADCADTMADVVICRHVIEHVPSPVQLLLTIRQALVKSPNARVFFETPCVKWILRNKVIWDFFYEHCSYFTPDSLTVAFEVAGFEVKSVKHVFEDQYLWLEAVPQTRKVTANQNPDNISRLAKEFAEVEANLKSRWTGQVKQLTANGNVAIWGAGAKGATFANLIDPERKLINCVIDINPQKQGYYIPGTGHPIVHYHELLKRGVTDVVLMNPNYHKEVQELIQTAGLSVNVIDLMEDKHHQNNN